MRECKGNEYMNITHRNLDIYAYIHIVLSLNCILSRDEYNTICVVVDILNKQVVCHKTELGDHIHAEAEKSKKG